MQRWGIVRLMGGQNSKTTRENIEAALRKRDDDAARAAAKKKLKAAQLEERSRKRREDKISKSLTMATRKFAGSGKAKIVASLVGRLRALLLAHAKQSGETSLDIGFVGGSYDFESNYERDGRERRLVHLADTRMNERITHGQNGDVLNLAAATLLAEDAIVFARVYDHIWSLELAPADDAKRE